MYYVSASQLFRAFMGGNFDVKVPQKRHGFFFAEKIAPNHCVHWIVLAFVCHVSMCKCMCLCVCVCVCVCAWCVVKK